MPGRKETPTEPLRDAQDATGREWVGALVIKDGDGKKWALDSDGIYRDLYPSGLGALLRPSVSIAEPVTVILDADGNPSHLRDMEQSRNEIAGTWATVCDHMDLAPDVTTGEFNTAVDALAERYHATGYQQGLKDSPTELADGNPPTAEPQHKRCGSEHPSNPTVIPCQLDAGHDGPHYSSTGCAGSGMSWGIDKDVSPPASLTTEQAARVADGQVAEILAEAETNRLKGTIADLAKQCNNQEQELDELRQALTEMKPEPVWLDAAQMLDLPRFTVVFANGPTPLGRVARKLSEGWYVTGNDTPFESYDLAPARVLWTPEANR